MLALPIALAIGLLLIGAVLADGLVITIDDGVATVHPGDFVTYTVSVTNSDVLSPAHDLLITGSLPISSMQLISAGDGFEIAPGLVSWGPITLAAGSTLSRTLAARLLDPLFVDIAALTTTASSRWAVLSAQPKM
ncbi:MAG: hypothetical protein HC802_20620 [Caldilineaceae bacterium]|nr:hypothetical protein [Caldilineaceae bacterium]